MNARLEKYISIFSDSHVALRALQAAERTSQLVWQVQRALNDISSHHSVDFFGSPYSLGYMEVKLPMSLQRKELHEFVGPEFALGGVSRQNRK